MNHPSTLLPLGPMNPGWSWEGLPWTLSVATVFSATRTPSVAGKSSRFCQSCMLKMYKNIRQMTQRPVITYQWTFTCVGSRICSWEWKYGYKVCLEISWITPSPNLDVSRFQNSWNQWIKFTKHFDSQKFSPDFCGFAPQGRLGRSTSLALKFLERLRDPRGWWDFCWSCETW